MKLQASLRSRGGRYGQFWISWLPTTFPLSCFLPAVTGSWTDWTAALSVEKKGEKATPETIAHIWNIYALHVIKSSLRKETHKDICMSWLCCSACVLSRERFGVCSDEASCWYKHTYSLLSKRQNRKTHVFPHTCITINTSRCISVGSSVLEMSVLKMFPLHSI